MQDGFHLEVLMKLRAEVLRRKEKKTKDLEHGMGLFFSEFVEPTKNVPAPGASSKLWPEGRFFRHVNEEPQESYINKLLINDVRMSVSLTTREMRKRCA